MTTEHDLEVPSAVRQKPRLVLMGEFSSGKSTLSNILLGGLTLPMQVTATRLPPVHVTHGAPSAFAVTRAGDRVVVDLSGLAVLSPEEFRSLHVTMESDTLELCDLIDMPGISDPNMPTDTWDSLVGPADHVIWCTHATQAWRQSEAAAWDRMREATSGRNLLLVTQFDKLRTPRDRARVLDRVKAETAGKFSAVFPVSLLAAMAAGDDFDAWRDSGAHAFMERLVEILLAPPARVEDQRALDASIRHVLDPNMTACADQAAAPTTNFDQSDRHLAEHLGNIEHFAARNEPHVMPRRVQAKPGASDRARPQRSASADTHAWPAEPEML